ncbi:Glycosyl transferase family 13 [Arabidopsis suecica]|uniref:Alpha-1,3-mannosyl-glycoprotein 2-beta-N-acetylglucosaminyltransferase n=1 Tax=Arabidopsis suecica TaxID=45249 RepID=A0A8T2EH32_ARASU|nr:Glycosyl transferase family 13 [Arabidopsis suecica]
MARISCDLRFLLIPAAFMFIYIQMRLFQTQSQYADRLSSAIESENHCTSQMRGLIDEVSIKQSRIVALEDMKNRQDEELVQLKDLIQTFEKKGIAKLTQGGQMPVAAVVIMACSRADYLERTVKSVLTYQTPVASKYPLFISQDGSDQAVKSKSLSYNQLTYMQHLDFEPVVTERPGELTAYYKIARHYKWALDQLFYKHKFSRVIILEDDMEIAPDFFDYFEAAASLMDRDKTIMAASSWNDNGQKQFVHDPYALYRSDFFPGLGWMLKRSTWDELSPKWPKAYWDDWLRLKENHKGRQFIRPEVCRTYNFGEHGSSLGQFFSQYLEPIKLNDVTVSVSVFFTPFCCITSFHWFPISFIKVDWKAKDLGYLTEGNYTKYFSGLVRQARPIQGSDLVLKAQNIKDDVRIRYKDQVEFERIAGEFGIFEEWKDGVPRTAYKGVVVFRIQTTRRVFLVGPDSVMQLGIRNS